MTTFKNPHDPDNILLTTKLEAFVRSKMSLPETTVVQVLELNCMDPGCMDKETRIIITSGDNNTKQLRIHKPLVYVRQRDIEHVLANL
jgi:hypothetical protein